jgi:hypothetical protein
MSSYVHVVVSGPTMEGWTRKFFFSSGGNTRGEGGLLVACVQQEEDLERQAKLQEAERYREQMEQARLEAEAEKQRRKEAFER